MEKRMGRLIAGAGVAALAAGFVGLAQQNVKAATQTSSFTVSASVTANCTISAGALAFNAYDPVVTNASANLDQTSTITVACTKGASASVALDNGANFSSGRRMTDGSSNYLGYELYSNSGRTTVWNSSAPVSYTAASKAASSLTVYGRVAGGQDVPAGSYSDTVVATVTF